VGDVVNIARNFDREKKGIIYGCSCFEEKEISSIDEVQSKYYLVMDVADKPGVLANIARVFGENDVSINSMIQKQADDNSRAKLIFITHQVSNKDLYSSVKEIEKLDVVEDVRSIIRVEDLD
jgi:homoserine dehydrogenase